MTGKVELDAVCPLCFSPVPSLFRFCACGADSRYHPFIPKNKFGTNLSAREVVERQQQENPTPAGAAILYGMEKRSKR